MVLDDYKSAVDTLAFSFCGDFFAAGDRSGKLYIWKTYGWEIIHSIDSDRIADIDFCSVSGNLAVGTTDGTVYFLDVK